MNTEQFKNFEKNLLVYFDAPQMEYKKDLMAIKNDKGKNVLQSGDIKDALAGKERSLDEKKFDSVKSIAEEVIKQINLDANPDIQSPPEKELMKKLLAHNEAQFTLLEHNYQIALDELGSEQPEMAEAEIILGKATAKFIEQLAAHIMKETAVQGTTEARGEIIDNFIESRGDKYAGLRGFGRCIVKGNWPIFGRGGTFERAIQNLKTEDEINDKMEEFLNQEKVLESAIWAMRKELPGFDEKPGERTYFQGEFVRTKDTGKDRLTYTFGKDNNPKFALDTLCRRFHVQFKKNGKTPEYFIDMKTDGTFKPGAEWDEHLKSVCHNDITNAEITKEENKQLDVLAKEQNDQFDELLTGKGFAWRHNQLEGLSDLKNNSELTALLQKTNDYYEKVNAQVSPARTELARMASEAKGKAGWALDSLARNLSPEQMRERGLVDESLATLMQAIKALFDRGDHEGLSQMATSVKEGKTLSEIKKETDAKKEAVKKNYETLLEREPKPELHEIISFYADPKKANEFFKGEALQTANEESQKLVKMYPEFRMEAIKKHLEDRLDVKNLIIRIDGATTTLTFKSKTTDKINIYKISKQADGKMKVQKDGKETGPMEFTLSELKKVMDGHETTDKAELEKEIETYQDILQGFTTDAVGTKELKTLAKKYTKKEMLGLQGEGTTNEEKEQDLISKIAGLLMGKLDTDKDFLRALKSEPVIKQVLAEKKATEEKTKETTKATREQLRLYANTLESLISKNPKGISTLGTLIKLLQLGAGEPKWENFKSEKNKNKRQVLLDIKRAELILGKLREDAKFIDQLKKDSKFAAALQAKETLKT